MRKFPFTQHAISPQLWESRCVLVPSVTVHGKGDGNGTFRRRTAIGPVLLFEFSYLPQYVIYFGLGLYAYRCQWFDQPNLFGAKRYWAIVFIGTVIVFQTCIYYVFKDPILLESKSIMIALWFLRYCVCASCFVVLLSFGLRYWNSPRPIHQHLAANSYRFYILHPAIVVLVQLGFYCWTDLSWQTTLAGTILFSLLATYLVSVLVGAVSRWVVRLATVTRLREP